MKVYIVTSHWGEYEDKYSRLEGVFDSSEKATQCKEEVEKREIITKSEEKLYYKLQEVIFKIEDTLLESGIGIDSKEWDEEIAQMFRKQTNYELQYYEYLDSKTYSDYKYCDIIEEEVR